LNRAPIAQDISTRIDKWDFIKLKGFCAAKKTIAGEEIAYRVGKKSLLATDLTGDLYTEYIDNQNKQKNK
jgi:hypothetical protein